MKVKIQNTLTKKLKLFRKKMKDLDKRVVKVGYFDGKIHQSSELTFASLMQMLHDGYGNVPDRPVIRETLRHIEINKKHVINSVFRKHIDDSPEILCQALGKVIMEEIQSQFGAGNNIGLAPNPMPNSKNRDDPLVDTGMLRENMEVRVD